MQMDRSTLDDGFGNWLAGFVDGEGCFFIGPSAGKGYVFRFTVCLRDDDSRILHECRWRTGLGLVEDGVPGRGGSSPQSRWIVQRKTDCFLLVGIFDSYPLRAKKARDYAIWREAVLLWHSIPRSPTVDNPANWTRIAQLRDDLRVGRGYQAA